MSSKVFDEFSKTFFWLKNEECRYCVWKFKVHRHFSFPIETFQLFQHPEHVKFQLFPLNCPSRNAISSKAFNEFSKTFFYLKDEECGYCGWKFEKHKHYSFAIATLQLFKHPELVKSQLFPLHSPSRNAISSKVFNEFSNTFLWLRDEECGYSWWKIWSAQIFWFCNSNFSTVPTPRKCKNFNFSHYTVPAEMLCLQKYLTNFQKPPFGWKMRNVLFCLKIWKCTDILVFQ